MISKLVCAVVLACTPMIAACGSSGGDSAPPTTTSSEPGPPVVANAGTDQSVFIGSLVRLDGSKSTNAKGTGLTYSWTLKKPAGSNATLSSASTVNPTFTADVGGIYEGTLVVTSPEETSSPDTILVTASGTNPPPVANAGPNQNSFTGRAIVLDGTKSSDPNGDQLSFTWTVTGKPAGSSPTLLDATTAIGTLVPDMPGNYVVRLVVNDGTSDSTPASITVTAANKPAPTANAGNDQFVAANTSLITLNGGSSQTNPPGEILAYEWTLNSSTFPVVLNNADKAVATFALPANTAGTVVAQLKITELNHPDPSRNFGIDTVKITVGPLATVKVFRAADLTTPILTCNVTACPSTTVVVNTELRLDSSESLVQPLTSLWRVTSPLPFGWFLNGSSTNSTATGTTVNFQPLHDSWTNSSGQAYTLQLTVSDTTGKSDVRSFTITARPHASASFTWSPLTALQGNRVTLSPTIDANSNLRYLWQLVPPPSSTTAFSDPTARNQTFTADTLGHYEVKLRVTDIQTGTFDEITNTITATTRPTANITVPNPVNVCSTVTLSATTDSGRSISSYLWTLVRPAGSVSELNNRNFPTPTFKVDKRDPYTVRLSITDNLQLSNFPESSRDFTPVRNATGQAIYDSGLNMPGVTQCTNCHNAGNYKSVTNPISSKDLSETQFTIQRITTQLNNAGHSGGKTTLSDPELSEQVTALRQFLDSTLATCPP